MFANSPSFMLVPEPAPESASGWQDAHLDELWDLFEAQQKTLGHGHPKVLHIEEQLARVHYKRGDLQLARDLFEEVLVYWSVLDGDQGRQTVAIAAGLFELLCEVGDRSAMAEVYYRYLSWLTMRSPQSLEPALMAIHVRVEELIHQSC